ncbi:contractile injection system tape measure protein [Candidatus Thiothrix sp. Deng01]|uniref:Contractile injection system tape measure protein n=1 Tax=Candidatus Thiothrix phosphatis TaxID=3112415 RepID=A0ABU6D3N9_9GAMM|nr:contractile injection system tape measure protein [Candidatus Thiothrix sp. Deng01]MEB4593421.1 contractile injection system tape measure protein [Candidatus Thiothrix sp. Deng01]
MPHLIHQQYLHAELDGTEQDGLRLQQRLSDWCRHQLPPVIERVLSRFATADEHWLIGRLEVDLGGLPDDCDAAVWETATERAFTQALRTCAPAVGQAATATPHSDASRRQNTQEHLQTAFLHFLATGTLPWHCQLAAGETLEQRLLADWQMDAPALAAPAFKPALLELLAASAIARRRLAWQFSLPFRQRLLQQLAPDYAATLSRILHKLAAAPLPPTVQQAFDLSVWESACLHLSQRQRADEVRLLETSLRLFHDATPPTNLAAVDAYAELTRTFAQPWPEIRLAPTTSGGDSGADGAPAGISRQQPQDKRLPPAVFPSPLLRPQDAPTPPDAPTLPPPNTVRAPDTASVQEQALYTGQAGLVLLHPFLPQFFTALGIAEADRLLQPERAACLLYFLASGRRISPEYELTLPKILCCLPLDAPLPADAGLTDAEQAEAIALLDAVIHHWTALRNTSPDGLRGNFLLRQGKLSPYPDGGWLLQVEQQTHDLLLDQLPWGVSLLRLPWMPQLLRVEWRG